ncbi:MULTISPECIES: PhzF family phenazine biosynthesis protein [Providencia]|uniref:PhzF family phenazine biosynthesis protein n=1 Tax=Providencia TaxID=586 RepID=UPI001BD24012|nr:PhzF family phenazine biosynthesis isomerase [Providencia rettgeri]ELR5068419.1 PhzF family phenazine biosynthesis protein [Providencia rettgeri]ELR5220213.1 PhzF family phenazine biosynthesis protein [Providencia rettgeri]MDX7322570.1 PhzF family phenazine biosynthesis protein [Providencia rettgeri]
MPTKNTGSIEQDILVYLVNSFTQNNTGGNPAGVVLNPPALSTSQKIAIAQQVGFSETAFVYNSEDTDFEVDFYTAEGEVDFCGHATLAVFFTLASLKLISSGCYTQKTKAGVLSVSVSPNNIVMDQALPTLRTGPNINEVAAALGITREMITETGLPIMIVSTGLPDIIIPVNTGYLDLLQPNYEAITRISKESNAIGFHVFELSEDPSITAHCRNFAPLYGINEESATGSASGALGCYLVNYILPNKTQFLFEQGRAMGCSSLIHVTIHSQAKNITQVKVGGQAAMIDTQIIHI